MMVEKLPKMSPDRLEDLSIEEIVQSVGEQRRSSQRLALTGVAAAAMVALLSAATAFWLYFDTQEQFNNLVRQTDERTIHYNEDIAARDAQIADLTRQVLELSNQNGEKVLAVGPNGTSILECRITRDGALLVDLEQWGCAKLATFSDDGLLIAVLGRTNLVSVFEISGTLRYQVKAASEVVALTWEGNNLSLQGAHDRQVYGPDGNQIALPITNVARRDHTVFLQFAGAIVRGDMVTLAGQLVSMGWHVEGADRGGERLAGTYGFNEIRYTDDKDLEAATLLAKEVASAASQVGFSTEIKVARVNGINPGTLEIWLSRL